jgi:hypothetical protein
MFFVGSPRYPLSNRVHDETKKANVKCFFARLRSYDTLIHAPYLDTLPSPDQLRTPLHFTSAELDALRGTNLHGATIDRRRVWEAEWERCRADVSAVDVEWGRALTWCVNTFRSPLSRNKTVITISLHPHLVVLALQGAFPHCCDLPVLTRVSVDSPLALALPRPAA